MTARAVLAALHSSVPSLVVFRLAALAPLMSEVALRRMLGLPDSIDLGAATHAAISPFGPLVAQADGRIAHCRLGIPPPVAEPESLLGAYAPWLAALPSSEPDCLGVGRRNGHGPVALHVRVNGADADAVSALTREPSRRDYELLSAVGVRYLGGERRGSLFVARFRNRLDHHLLAARLAGFARTDQCNAFFLAGGEVDESLAHGLRDAATARIAEGLARARVTLTALSRDALLAPAALLCVPPPPASPEPYGDAVVLGVALAALRSAPETRAAAEAVSDHLLAQRRQGLWSYHKGGLLTATDTALVLQGFERTDLAALEAFCTPEGGYVPQLWAAQRDSMHMLSDPGTWHWRQPDVATTALVVGCRRRAGLSVKTSARWLSHRLEHRSGLFFANPYLTDWAFARALGDSQEEAELRNRLRAEIVASARADHSFGAYDETLSTSLAILALAALRERSRTMRLAQLRLLELLEAAERQPAAVPFYSSVDTGDDAQPPGPQVVPLAGGVHALTYYVDAAGVMTAAFAAMALAVPTDDNDEGRSAEPTHPRYECPDVAAYVTRFALPPYLKNSVADGPPTHEQDDAVLT